MEPKPGSSTVVRERDQRRGKGMELGLDLE
jgi:hypothetical protein